MKKKYTPPKVDPLCEAADIVANLREWYCSFGTQPDPHAVDP